MSSKTIVTNYAALTTKYGSPGVAKLKKAVARLVAADKQRGLTTRVADLSSAANMKAAGAKKVDDPQDRRANKEAIDAVFRKVRPDYLMILGSVDVVPHQEMDNPSPAATATRPSPATCRTRARSLSAAASRGSRARHAWWADSPTSPATRPRTTSSGCSTPPRHG